MGEQSKKELADKAANENWRAYERARDSGHATYVDDAKKYDKFYKGGGLQWNPVDKARLDADGRPALEINMILSTVNAVLGEQSSQRADITFKPRREATEETSHVLSQLAQQIQDNNQYEYVESQVFADGVIQDRGYFDIRLDFSDHIEGEIRINAEDPLNILPDPNGKDYDPKTWNEVTKTRWMSLDDIEMSYGKDKREKVEDRVASNGVDYGVDSIRFEETTFGNQSSFYDEGDGEDRTIKKVRVIERQHRRLKLCQYFVDNETGDTRVIPSGWSEEKIQKVAATANMSIMKKTEKKIRWTVSVDGITLHDDWSPYKNFTIVPFFPYFRRGEPFGIVRNLISPQEQLNKIESQELHIINTTANSGWILEAGSLTNMDEDELEERGAETGLVLVHNKDSAAPEKIQPNTIPSGIDRLAQKAADSIKTISGVYDAMLGSSGSEVSGVAITKSQARGMVQMQVPFDNLNRSRRILAERMLELIQDFYTETRVLQVIDYNDPEQPSQELTINAMDAAGEIINNVTLGEYDVVISSSPARDSFIDTQFAEALQLRDVGVQIPDDVVIENSHLARKKEIAKRVRDMMGMGEPTEEQLAQMQMMQEIEMKRVELEFAEMEAKVGKLQAEAQATLVKAGVEEGDAQLQAEQFSAEFSLKVQQMKQEWMKHVTDLQSKRELAGIHTKSKLDNTLYTTSSKRATEEMRMRNDIDKTILGLSQQPRQGDANGKERRKA